MAAISGSATAPIISRRRVFQYAGMGSIGATLGYHAVARAVVDQPSEPRREPFDFEHGNAPVEVIIPAVVPKIYSAVSPVANDASLVLRITAIVTNAWFDAIAPYHATARGIYSDLRKRPASEATDASRNTAIFYASKRVLDSLLPQYAEDWRAMLESVGLNPDDARRNLDTAIGIGNVAGDAIVEVREHDGMNQLGDEGDTSYNRRPYADYLGYAPVNSAFELRDPARWQPNVISPRVGIFVEQCFVTPHMRATLPYSFDMPDALDVPPPVKSAPRDPGYKEQVDEVLSASATLTDYQKMAAELFDNKILGLGFSALFASARNQLSLEELVHYDFMTNMAAFNTIIAAWTQKHRYDAVRPFSAIRHVYGDDRVTAWGGPGMGTVDNLPASQWRSYLNTADHPEYPSGSSALCAAHAEASRLYLGSDSLGWTVPAAAGSSRIEPGITPSTDLVLGPWETWSDLVRECGLSRLWGGVHFMSAIEAGMELGTSIGKVAHEFVMRHIDGQAS